MILYIKGSMIRALTIAVYSIKRLKISILQNVFNIIIIILNYVKNLIWPEGDKWGDSQDEGKKIGQKGFQGSSL